MQNPMGQSRPLDPKTISLEDAHGDTPVSFIGITLYRSGVMKLEGAITDEEFGKYMLDTAQATLKEYHRQQRQGNRSPIIVNANDTALVGTPQEKKLLKARDELDNLIRET